MSLEIRSGGAIAVDPATLREAAAQLAQARAWVDSAALQAASAEWSVRDVPVLSVDHWGVAELEGRIRPLASGIDDLVARIRRAADAYELVELRVRAEFLLAWAGAGAAADERRRLEEERRRIDERIRELGEGDPAALAQADQVMEAWRQEYGKEFLTQWLLSSATLAPLSFLAMGLVATLPGTLLPVIPFVGRGVVRPGEKLVGSADPVRVDLTTAPVAGAPPRSLADAAARIPGGDDARVRVERYEMPDGTSQFAVYLAGTDGKGADAWDWESNIQLYAGQRSASFQAAMDALERAGAKPGDVLHTFGFSQGGMIGARLATEGDFDVRTTVSFGSPVHADAGPDALSVTVRHDDDPVPLLAGGGLATGGGSDESLVVVRTFDEGIGPGDLLAPAHRLDAYVETAALIDESADTRVGAVRDALAELGAAVDVRVTEYSATRIEE